MAIIHQTGLFSWEPVEAASDLDRLRVLLEALPDEGLMRELEVERNGRRDEYRLRAVWNSVLAGIVFQHQSAQSLRRELRRNAQLRQVCGFDVFRGAKAVAPEWVYTRFMRKLMRHQKAVDAMLDALVNRLEELLPDFGRRLAADSKAISSHGKPPRTRNAITTRPWPTRDSRRTAGP